MADVMVLGLLLAWLFLPLAAVGSIVRSPSAAWSAAGRSKGTTALLVILAGAVGAAYYFIRIRGDVRRAERTAAPARRKVDVWADEPNERGWR